MKRVHCEGAPRDLGHDQGVALRDEIRAAVGADSWWGWLASLRSDAATARLHRDLRRYFPHQAESLEGMARAAGVPRRALVRALAASAHRTAPLPSAVAAHTGVGTRIATPVPPRAFLREARPEGRFASVELVLPTATSPIAGVNEVGLAVAVVPRPVTPSRFAAPVSLLARECLERFETIEPALEWCLSRPAAAGGALLLADASGGLAGVDAAASHRRTIVANAGWLALGVGEHEPPAWWKRGEITDVGALESALATTLASRAPPGGASLFVDPAGRRLFAAGVDWISAGTGSAAP